MTDKKRLFDEADYEMTGNPAVDQVIACISYHRQHNKFLKTIYLRHDFYYMFASYIESKGMQVQDKQGFDIDGVEIDLSPMDISDSMSLVFKN